ncbi:MAG: hypothetical protein IJ415_02275, partial [Clostridia bacterium]|nr:hypothetical protein [Clostridia bacterium]
EKSKKEKVEKVKQSKVKPTKKFNIKPAAIWLTAFLVLFVVCCFPSNFLKNFLLGMFGLSVYPITLIGVFFSVMSLKKKKVNAQKKYIVYISVAVCVVWFIFHLILTSKLSLNSFGTYLKESYVAKTTAGGILFSLISYPVVKVLTYVGAYIFSAIILAVFVGLIVDYVNVERNLGKAEKKVRFSFDSFEDLTFDEKPIETITHEEHVKKVAKQKLGLEKGETTIISSSMPRYDTAEIKTMSRPMSKKDYILTPLDPVIPTDNTKDMFDRMPKKSYTYEKINKPQKSNFDNDSFSSITNSQPTINTNKYIEEIKPVKEIEKVEQDFEEVKPITYETNYQEVEEVKDDFMADEEDLSEYETAFETDTDFDETEEVEEYDEEDELEDLNEEAEKFEDEPEVEEVITPDINEQDYVDEYAVTGVDKSGLGSTVDTQVVRPSAVDLSKFNLPNMVKKPVQEEKPKVEERKKLDIPPYVAPPVELLHYMENVARISDEELQDNIERLEQVLEDFKVPAKVNNVQVGPAVTRYELTMPRGISVNKIAQMADDIAMTLASNGSIRVEAPITGKN